MTQRFSNAVVTSALFHAGAIVLIVAITYVAGLRSTKPVDFFELVAGDGDNYTATEAPALGTADGSQASATTAAAPSPTMVMTAKAPTPTPAPKEVDLTKNLKKAVATSEKKVVAKNKADDAKAAKEEAAKLAKMSKEEFDRQNKGKTTPAPSQKTNVPKIDTKGIPAGVLGGSAANTKGGAGGKALTSAGGGLVEAYTALLINKLRSSLEDQKPPGLSDKLVAKAGMRVLADGTLSSARIVTSSGNTEFDKAVLDAIRITNMPDRPTGFQTGEVTLDFKAKTADDP